MSKNVDVVAVVVLLAAAALFGGVRNLVVMSLHGSSRLIHIQRPVIPKLNNRSIVVTEQRP